MSDPEKRNQGKGFKGLQSLGSISPEPLAPAEHNPDPRELPPTWEEGTTEKTTEPQPVQSQTAAPLWRGWVIGLGVLGAIAVFLIWAGNQSSSRSSYSPSTATGYSSSAPVEPPPRPATTISGLVEPAPGPAITMPPVGDGLVLTNDQVRYCVYEDRRIKGAERAVNSYDQTSVNAFNAMVDDYNSRCSYFQYRQGALTPIQSEADQIQAQLEQEGRERMFSAAAGAAFVHATASSNDSGSLSSDDYYSDASEAAADAAAPDSTEEAPGGWEVEGDSTGVDPEN